MKFKQFSVVLVSLGLLFSEMSFAGRLGGGRNRGMQRSIQPNSYNHSNSFNNNRSYNNYNNSNSNSYSNNNGYNNNNTNTPRRGMSAGTGAMLGAAAGAVGGYMLGKSSNENNGNNNNANTNNMNQNSNASNVVAQNAQPVMANSPSSTNNLTNNVNFPWGIIVILLVLLGIGLLFFRKKTSGNPVISAKSMGNPNNKQSKSSFSIFKQQTAESINAERIEKNINNQQHNPSNANSDTPQNFANSDRMPDGIEKVYFLRQVKGMFLHIQSMNNKDNLTEVEKYLTPELYRELHDEIANNSVIADFNNLDCKIIDSEQKDGTVVASVEFSAMVSDDPKAKPEPFNEIWNFIKPDIQVNKWLVAGIQQKNPTTNK